MKHFSTLFLLITVALGAFCKGNEQSEAVLREINFARTNPQEYARIVAAQPTKDERARNEAVNFLNRARPLHPLTFSNGLAMGAMSHVTGQGSTGATGHQGADRSSPWDRMGRFGTWRGTVGENISYGISSPRQIVVSLIVDAGVSGRGHRKNIFSPGFGTVGVANGPHSRWGTMCVMDFAGAFIEKPAVAQNDPRDNRS